MKKNLIYLFILLSLTGCGKEKKSSNVPPTKTNTTITLEGNETTGYTWTCTEENNYLKIKSTYQEDTKKDEDITGVGGIYTITLTGLKEGTTELTCQYKRDWEEEAEETRTYPVEIDKNLKVRVGNPTISNNKEATDNTKENAPTQTKELKTFTFNNAYGTETLEAEEALTATGTAGASNIIFYLKENKLYLYGHGE